MHWALALHVDVDAVQLKSEAHAAQQVHVVLVPLLDVEAGPLQI